jgi:hypothetical protein
VVEKCTIKWNNGTGIRVFGTYSHVTKNHVWGNMLYNWPRGQRYAANGGWGQGMTVGGYGVASGNISHDNGGEGMGVYGGTGHVTFQDNISYDNYSVGLYLDNAPACTFQRNLVYAHDPDSTNAVEAWQLPQWIIDAGAEVAETAKIVARMRQEGIMAGDESATNPNAQSAGFKAANNIIVGCRRGFTTYGQATGAGLNNYVIAGNTIVLPTAVSAYGTFVGIQIMSSANNTGSLIKNNLVYSTATDCSTQSLVAFASNTAMQGVDFNNNAYYSVNGSTPFLSGAYPTETTYNFTNWKAYVPTGYETTSAYGSPVVAGGSDIYAAAYYVPGNTSSAKGIASVLDEFLDDFYAVTRGAAWDAGAIIAQ